MPQRALITGITGQDGSYLAEFLVARGYEVWGTVRDAEDDPQYIRPLLHAQPRPVQLRTADMRDQEALKRVISACRPDEIYNLAAQSHVGQSLERPAETGEVTGLGPVNLLEAVRAVRPEARVFHASSAEMFGAADESPQTEQTPFRPMNPYAAAKVYAHQMMRWYRRSRGMFVACGILFNHESPRRPEQFVTRKITRGAAVIVSGRQQTIALGNLDSARDWGFAGDYVEAMWLMLQQASPDDFVISTGEVHSVREFCSLAFEQAGLPLMWRGNGLQEIGVDRSGVVRVQVDPSFYRPHEPQASCGDAGRAKSNLGWSPRHQFADLVRMMVDHDLRVENENHV